MRHITIDHCSEVMPTKWNVNHINTHNKYSRLVPSPREAMWWGWGVPEVSASTLPGGVRAQAGVLGPLWSEACTFCLPGLIRPGAPPPSPSQHRAQATPGRTGLALALGARMGPVGHSGAHTSPPPVSLILSNSRPPSCCYGVGSSEIHAHCSQMRDSRPPCSD